MGWERNARIVCNDIELIVTLDIGPRVVRYGFIDGPNIMQVFPASAGKTGGEEWVGYGGHRLWIAPETKERSMQPDNSPVDYTIEGETHVFTTPPDKYFVQKQIRITPNPATGAFLLEHRVYNHSTYDLELAPWSATICVGGEVIIPMPPFEPHSSNVLPACPFVLWTYTKLHDSRFTIGDHVTRFAYDPTKGPTKLGALIKQGYAALAYEGHTFLKRFAYDPNATYADYGCNFETFSRQDMIEIESLGAFQVVKSGTYAQHDERWYLLRSEAPAEDAACGAWLAALAQDNH